jgi:hypothetical protein
VTASQAVLLPELYECGVRCIELFRRIGGEIAYQAEHLEPFAQEARRRLDERGLLSH